MIPDVPTPTQTEPGDEPPRTSTAVRPIGYALLAQRIARRTTDLLAISVIAVGGLSMAGHVTEWWLTDPREVTSAARQANLTVGNPAPWGGDGSTVSLRFGDQPFTLRKEVVAGDRASAANALLAVCRRSAIAAGPPSQPITDQERRLLEQVAGHTPVEQQGEWKLYQVDETLPLVVGIRERSAGSRDEQKLPADNPQRVVCWGMAFPYHERQWTLFTFGTSDSAVPSSEQVRFDLPANTRRILSVRSVAGDALIGFEGSGPAGIWVEFFDRWFQSRGWHLSGGWRTSPIGRTARYERTNSTPPGYADVQLARRNDGWWQGMINVVGVNRKSGQRGRP